MHRTNRFPISVTISVLMYSAGLLAATVAIDATKQFQTIEGFGSCYNRNTTSSTYMTFLHDDVGYTMVRLFMPFENFQTQQGGAFNINDGVFQGNLGVLNGMKKYADVRYITTIWTPPAWMKYHHDVNNGDSLLPSMIPALADYFMGIYNTILQQTGVRLYGLSIQNEPAFPEPYASCVYSPAEYRDLLKAVGKKFEDAGIDIKLFGPEDMVDAISIRGHLASVNQDTAAKRMIDAIAVHGYTDGVNPTPTSNGAFLWGRLARSAVSMGNKGVWMTETSGFSNDWSGASELAGNLYLSLRYGNLSLWTYWEDNRCDGGYGLLCNSAHTVLSLASKNFYRYIRPGAVRINATPDDTTCYVVAFNQKTDKTLTLVIYNGNGNGYTLNLTGANLPAQFAKYTTTASKACVSEGSVGARGISSDGHSVTTRVGSGSPPPAVAVTGPRRQASGISDAGVGDRQTLSLYDVMGRRAMAGLLSRESGAAGVYFAIRGVGPKAVGRTTVIVGR
jgi:glucuronoarabinoxylan endo-1,4-beta-xylanase